MSGPFRPTREQETAIRALGGPLSISAGAGSGKTRVLAERFVTAADPRAPIEGWSPAGVGEILTVTFTDKAAGEIAERVRRVFLEHGLVAHARRVDEAWISTIHGLCMRLLRAHALEAGLDPRFGVISTVDAGVLREEVLEEVLGERLRDGRASDLVGTYGVGGVEEHVLAVYDRLRAMGSTAADIVLQPSGEPADVLGRALAATRDWAGRLRAHPATGVTLERVIAALEEASEALAALEERGPGLGADHSREVLRIMHGVRLPLNVGGAKETAAVCSAERTEVLDGAVRAVAAPLERALVELVGDFSTRYQEAKAARGVMDFEDLQLGALALLASSHGPAERYRTLFRLVMIDEFQDTNEVQAALADLLSDGDLCTVGDERQSIYGFRYADVDVYREHTRAMGERGAVPVALADNFRSHGDLLAFVNATFTDRGLFGEGFARLRHGRDEDSVPPFPCGEDPRIALLLVHRAGRGAEAARGVEADAMARRLRAMVDAGVPQGDIVVLMRAMTHVDEYAAALRRHDLDHVIVAGGSFFGRPEVEAVRAFLRTASNPLDDEALAALLASGMAGMSDDGLARLRAAADEAGRRPLWTVMGSDGLAEPDVEVAERVRRAVESARGLEGRVPVSNIIHGACEDLDYDLYLLSAAADGRRAYANVLKLARLADEAERAGRSGTRAFLEHLTLKERFRDREAPAPAVDERVDAVRIMTVHAAKGLEFPVVAVPELGRDLAGDRGPLVLEKDGSRANLALCLPDAGSGSADERRSSWARAARERARDRDVEEEKRLLYVACTRAREALVLSGAGNLEKPGGDRPLGWLRAALGLDAGDVCSGVIVPEGVRVDVVRLEECGPVPEPAPGRPRPARACAPLTEAPPAPVTSAPRAGTPPTISHSAMRAFETCGLRYYAERVARIGQTRQPGGDAPLRLGEAVHAALRLAGPAGAPPPDRLAAIAMRWRLLPDEERRMGAAVAGFIGSEAGRRAYAGAAVAREVPFAVPLEGVTLVGKIDLLSKEGDGVLVVDYKTGPDAAGPDAREAYRAQSDCYALAVLADGAPSVEVVFVGVETCEAGRPREVSFSYAPGDLEALRAAIGDRAARATSGPYEPLAGYAPGACDGCAAAGGVCPVKAPRRREPRG